MLGRRLSPPLAASRPALPTDASHPSWPVHAGTPVPLLPPPTAQRPAARLPVQGVVRFCESYGTSPAAPATNDANSQFIRAAPCIPILAVEGLNSRVSRERRHGRTILVHSRGVWSDRCTYGGG